MLLFEKGREGFADGTLDWDTNSFKAALISALTADTGIKTITGATNATPIVVTATAHGFTNGDLVYIGGVVGNLAANGIWKIANQATNTFELQRPDGTNVVGSGAYSSGGYAINLGISASGDNWDDFDGALINTAQAITSPTVTGGLLGAAALTWTAVTGAAVHAVLIYKDTGTASTSRVAILLTGNYIVTCAAQAAASATSIAVEKLVAGIPNGTVLTFSNGATATLTAAATAGDRTLTVSALAAIVTVESRALALATGAGLPFTPSGANFQMSFPSGVAKL
ncbi:MAG TPA: hypothetical protein VK633_06390 [Verrucomicrobiae bacterium]|nr:hypothetical protein [Verrucomicrobiae bacterium]